MMTTAGTATVIPLSSQIEMPWKNGGGTTREICKREDAAGVVWRASIATIHQSGPFSLFPGCDRIITLIDGPPVALDFEDGEDLTLSMFAPEKFSCDRPVSATVTGTSHDLNLIWRRDAVSVMHSVHTLQGAAPITLPPAHWHLIVTCAGTVQADADGKKETMASGEALLFDQADGTNPLNLTLSSLSPLSSTGGTALAFAITAHR